MKEKIKLSILVLFLNISNFAQDFKTFEKGLITNETKLDLISTKKRGIQTKKKEIYYVEKNNQTISAYLNGMIKWKINVIKEFGKPKVGKPEIRFIELKKNIIFVTFGKHSFAEINASNGKAKFIGVD